VTERRRISLGARNVTPDEPEPLLAAPSPAAGRLELVHAEGVLRCGVVNHPPLSAWHYASDTAEFTGYYPELARQVGRETGLEIEFVDMDWGRLPSAFTDEGLDVVLSIFETRTRQEYADFAAALHKVGVSGVMSADRPPMVDVSELGAPDIKVGVVVGEVGWEYVTQELVLPRRNVIQVDSGTLRTAFSPLLSGEADIAIVDDLTCANFVAQHPGFQHVFTQDPLYLCKNSIMVPKGEPEFRRWIDTVFLDARRHPVLLQLENETLAATGGWVKKFR
jgi:ABC-type amino acid transport/signal transduction systems, periplasmic component/domain